MLGIAWVYAQHSMFYARFFWSNAQNETDMLDTPDLSSTFSRYAQEPPIISQDSPIFARMFPLFISKQNQKINQRKSVDSQSLVC